MVSDAVGLSGHLPECVLFVSFPSRMKRSGETLKRESDIRPRSASVGDNGSVGEGRESRAGKETTDEVLSSGSVLTEFFG